MPGKLNVRDNQQVSAIHRSRLPTLRARELRRSSTPAERLLWSRLRDRRVDGFKFRRQYPVEGFIVDFLCAEKSLVIEIDGGQHQTTTEYDARRTEALNGSGYRVLRFWNNEVLEQLDGVLDVIHRELLGQDAPHPSPLPEGEGNPQGKYKPTQRPYLSPGWRGIYKVMIK